MLGMVCVPVSPENCTTQTILEHSEALIWNQVLDNSKDNIRVNLLHRTSVTSTITKQKEKRKNVPSGKVS